MKLPFFHAKLLALIRLNTYLCRTTNRKGIVMEDILQFLVIAGIIALGVYRQFAKEKTKNAENERPTTQPEYEVVEMPTLSDFPQRRAPKKQKQQSLPQEGVRTTLNPRLHSSSDIAAAPLIEDDEIIDSEFAIHSEEEAKRAIIWSEILQRKY